MFCFPPGAAEHRLNSAQRGPALEIPAPRSPNHSSLTVQLAIPAEHYSSNAPGPFI